MDAKLLMENGPFIRLRRISLQAIDTYGTFHVTEENINAIFRHASAHAKVSIKECKSLNVSALNDDSDAETTIFDDALYIDEESSGKTIIDNKEMETKSNPFHSIHTATAAVSHFENPSQITNVISEKSISSGELYAKPFPSCDVMKKQTIEEDTGPSDLCFQTKGMTSKTSNSNKPVHKLPSDLCDEVNTMLIAWPTALQSSVPKEQEVQNVSDSLNLPNKPQAEECVLQKKLNQRQTKEKILKSASSKNRDKQVTQFAAEVIPTYNVSMVEDGEAISHADITGKDLLVEFKECIEKNTVLENMRKEYKSNLKTLCKELKKSRQKSVQLQKQLHDAVLLQRATTNLETHYTEAKEYWSKCEKVLQLVKDCHSAFQIILKNAGITVKERWDDWTKTKKKLDHQRLDKNITSLKEPAPTDFQLNSIPECLIMLIHDLHTVYPELIIQRNARKAQETNDTQIASLNSVGDMEVLPDNSGQVIGNLSKVPPNNSGQVIENLSKNADIEHIDTKQAVHPPKVLENRTNDNFASDKVGRVPSVKSSISPVKPTQPATESNNDDGIQVSFSSSDVLHPVQSNSVSSSKKRKHECSNSLAASKQIKCSKCNVDAADMEESSINSLDASKSIQKNALSPAKSSPPKSVTKNVQQMVWHHSTPQKGILVPTITQNLCLLGDLNGSKGNAKSHRNIHLILEKFKCTIAANVLFRSVEDKQMLSELALKLNLDDLNHFFSLSDSNKTGKVKLSILNILVYLMDAMLWRKHKMFENVNEDFLFGRAQTMAAIGQKLYCDIKTHHPDVKMPRHVLPVNWRPWFTSYFHHRKAVHKQQALEKVSEQNSSSSKFFIFLCSSDRLYAGSPTLNLPPKPSCPKEGKSYQKLFVKQNILPSVSNATSVPHMHSKPDDPNLLKNDTQVH